MKSRTLISALLIAAFGTMQLGAFAAMTGNVLGDTGNVNSNPNANITGSRGGFTGFTTDGKDATLNFRHHAVLEWGQLNTLDGQTLNFLNGNNVVLNKVSGGMSTFAGAITAERGRIIISNPNGMLWAGGTFYSQGPLTLTTQDVDLNLRNGNYNIAAPKAGDVSKGFITLDGADLTAGGDITLITNNGADFIAMRNTGDIDVKNGSTLTVTGTRRNPTPQVVMDAYGNINITESTITAENGTVALTSKGDINISGTDEKPTTITGDLTARAVQATMKYYVGDETVSSVLKDTINTIYDETDPSTWPEDVLLQALLDAIAAGPINIDSIDNGKYAGAVFGTNNTLYFDKDGNYLGDKNHDGVTTGWWAMNISNGGISITGEGDSNGGNRPPLGQVFEFEFFNGKEYVGIVIKQQNGEVSMSQQPVIDNPWKIETIYTDKIKTTYDQVTKRGDVNIIGSTINGEVTAVGKNVTVENSAMAKLDATAIQSRETTSTGSVTNEYLKTVTRTATGYTGLDGFNTATNKAKVVTTYEITDTPAVTASGPATTGAFEGGDITVTNTELKNSTLKAGRDIKVNNLATEKDVLNTRFFAGRDIDAFAKDISTDMMIAGGNIVASAIDDLNASNVAALGNVTLGLTEDGTEVLTKTMTVKNVTGKNVGLYSADELMATNVYARDNLELLSNDIIGDTLFAKNDMVVRSNIDGYDRAINANLTNIIAKNIDIVAFQNVTIDGVKAENLSLRNITNPATVTGADVVSTVTPPDEDILWSTSPVRHYLAAIPPGPEPRPSTGEPVIKINLGDPIENALAMFIPIAYAADDGEEFDVNKANFMKKGNAKKENEIIYILKAFKAF